MKFFLKIIIGVVILVFLVTLGLFISQRIKAKEEPGKDKFSIEATIKSIDPDKKVLVAKVNQANKTLENKVGQDLSLLFSDEGRIKGKSGQAIQLADLKPSTKTQIKGTISNDQFIAEYIIEE